MGGVLGPKYASMITIGAQFSGNKLSANATGFSTYNLGLEDRVITQKLNHDYDAGTEADGWLALVHLGMCTQLCACVWACVRAGVRVCGHGSAHARAAP